MKENSHQKDSIPSCTIQRQVRLPLSTRQSLLSLHTLATALEHAECFPLTGICCKCWITGKKGVRKRPGNLSKAGTKKAPCYLWLLTAVCPEAPHHCVTLQLFHNSTRTPGFTKFHPHTLPDFMDLCPMGDRVECDRLCTLLQIRHTHTHTSREMKCHYINRHN